MARGTTYSTMDGLGTIHYNKICHRWSRRTDFAGTIDGMTAPMLITSGVIWRDLGSV